MGYSKVVRASQSVACEHTTGPIGQSAWHHGSMQTNNYEFSSVLVNFISKEGNLLLIIFSGSMTSYPFLGEHGLVSSLPPCL